MAIPSQKGATGRFIGKIRQVKGRRLSFTSSVPLHLGERLRIQPANDKSGSAFTLRQLFSGAHQVKKSPAGKPVTVISPFDQRFAPGDSVFMVASADAFTLSDSAARRKLEHRRPGGEIVDLVINVSNTDIALTATINRQSLDFTYPITSFEATSQPLDIAVLEQVFAAVADEPFVLGSLSCGALPAIVIPPKQLKQIRRTFYRDLRLARQRENQQRRRDQREAAVASLLPNSSHSYQTTEYRVLLGDTREQHLLNNERVDTLLLPINRHSLQQADKLRRRAESIIWDLPFVLFDQDWQEHQAAIRTLVQAGYRRFRLSNLGHFPLFDGLSDLKLYSSYRLFALNSQAIAALSQLNIADTELYIEDDRHNLAAILSRQLPVPTSLVVYGRVPLLTSRIRVRQLRSDGLILSDRDDAYRVQQRQGLTWLVSETPFSFIANIEELKQLGCSGHARARRQTGAGGLKPRQRPDAVQQIQL